MPCGAGALYWPSSLALTCNCYYMAGENVTPYICIHPQIFWSILISRRALSPIKLSVTQRIKTVAEKIFVEHLEKKVFANNRSIGPVIFMYVYMCRNSKSKWKSLQMEEFSFLWSTLANAAYLLESALTLAGFELGFTPQNKLNCVPSQKNAFLYAIKGPKYYS